MIKVLNMSKFRVMNKVFNYTKLFARRNQTAIGVSAFNKLVINSNVFVDKSLLIRDFLNDAGESILVTFPRRWGKSINTSMIKTFLSIEVNENGELLQEAKRQSRKLFLGGTVDLSSGKKKELKALTIAECEDIVRYYQGRYPVISVNFKDTKGDSYEEVLESVKKELYKSFFEHNYLCKSSKLDEEEKTLFRIYTGAIGHKALTIYQVYQGLSTLSMLLHKHFGKNSYILMDEYDAAINHSYINLSNEESKKVLALFGKIIAHTFKDNVYLEKGLITGVLRLASEDYFSTLAKFRTYNILDKRYFKHYGFTLQEVEYLLHQYDVPEHLAKDIKSWYNGYMLHGDEIYSPWSIINCLTMFREQKGTQDIRLLKERILQSYWGDESNFDFLKDMYKVPRMKRNIDLLICNKPLRFHLINSFRSDHVMILQELINSGSKFEASEFDMDVLFSYLFYTGYLTVCGEEYSFKLPNNEIRTVLQNLLFEYYKQQYNINPKFFFKVTNRLHTILDSKVELETEEAIESFNESFVDLMAEFYKFEKMNDKNIKNDIIDNNYHGNDNLIHSLLCYIALQLRSKSKFVKEIYLGAERVEIMLTNKVSSKSVLLEIKTIKSAVVAQEYIETNKYAIRLSDEMDTIVIEINVSEKKEVEMIYHEIPKHGISISDTDAFREIV